MRLTPLTRLKLQRQPGPRLVRRPLIRLNRPKTARPRPAKGATPCS